MAKKLQLHGSFPSKAGENGGFYTPNVSQPNPETLMFAFEKSKEDMPTVPPVAFPMLSGAPEVHIGSEPPTNGEVIWINPDEEPESGGGTVSPEAIKQAVDAYLTENPQGGEVWEDISSGELTEEVSSIVIDKDSDGNAFNLSKGRLYLEVVGTSTNTVDRGLIKFSHNYRGSGGGAVEMGTLTRSKDGYKEFAMGDYDFSLDGRGVVKYIATQDTDKKAFMQIPLTKIYIDGTTENATMMGVGTRWLLRGVRK